MLGLTCTLLPVTGFTPETAPDAGPGPTHEECAESQALASRLLIEACAPLRRTQH